MTEKIELAIVALYRAGESVESIRKLFKESGVTRIILQRILQRRNVVIRRRADAAKMREQLHPVKPKYIPSEEEIAERTAEIREKNLETKKKSKAKPDLQLSFRQLHTTKTIRSYSIGNI